MEFKNEKREKELENAWAVHFENGKMIRLTKRYFDAETLAERSRYKLIAKNIPKWAIESVLLRQLRCINTKVVYISSNSNRNQRRTASIYFTNEQDYVDALQKTVYYLHTKLEWCHRNTLTTKSNHNTEGKGIVSGSNAIKIINKRSFSSSGDNRDINL